MHKTNQMRSAVVTIGPPIDLPWWWEHVKLDKGLCPLEFERVIFKNKNSKQITTLELPFLFFKMLKVLLRLRKRYDYIYTVETDLATFTLAFWQTVLFMRKPRHVVLQFIMREKDGSFKSRLKYAIMKFCFISLHKVICSASSEVEYYAKAFGWGRAKLAFVPILAGPDLLTHQVSTEEPYIISGGRVFRDFPTLLTAIKGADYKLLIIASKDAVEVPPELTNVEVLYDIPVSEFNELVARSSIVVLSLEDKQISVGQIVLLTAMALGKAVIATRTSGTVDYIKQGENGILVDAYNPQQLRNEIDRLLRDRSLRDRLGKAARETVAEHHLPHHYTQEIRRILTET